MYYNTVMKTSTNYPPRSIRRTAELEELLRSALALTPSLLARERGWFAQLIVIVLRFYVSKGAK
jgi:hypothetical protein